MSFYLYILINFIMHLWIFIILTVLLYYFIIVYKKQKNIVYI